MATPRLMIFNRDGTTIQSVYKHRPVQRMVVPMPVNGSFFALLEQFFLAAIRALPGYMLFFFVYIDILILSHLHFIFLPLSVSSKHD